MSFETDIGALVAEAGHVVVSSDGSAPPEGRPSWWLPVFIVATTIIVGIVLLFVLSSVADANAVGGCGGG